MTQMDWEVVIDILEVLGKGGKSLKGLLGSLDIERAVDTPGSHIPRLFVLLHRHSVSPALRQSLSHAIDSS